VIKEPIKEGQNYLHTFGPNQIVLEPNGITKTHLRRPEDHTQSLPKKIGKIMRASINDTFSDVVMTP